jgi:hypothetical protein
MHETQSLVSLTAPAVLGALLLTAASCGYPTRVFVDVDAADGGGQASVPETSTEETSVVDAPPPDAPSLDAPVEGAPEMDAPNTGNGPCAYGPPGQTFAAKMFGCTDVVHADPSVGGTTWANRATLCGRLCRVCTAQDWISAVRLVKPGDAYWIDDSLGGSGTPTLCQVDSDAGAASGDCASSPMHVCVSSFSSSPGVSGPSKDTCALHDCGFGGSRPNEYFGGCGTSATDTFAGTLCCCP